MADVVDDGPAVASDGTGITPSGHVEGQGKTRILDSRPSNLWCGDAETREVVEQLNRDAGYDPVYAGPIENAALQEGMVKIVLAISEGIGPFVYRMAPLEQL